MSYTDNYTRINWEDYPSNETPINATNLNKMDAAIKNLSAAVAQISGGGGSSASFPVGFVILTASNINPGNYFEGTWSQIAAGLALVGAGTGTDSNGVTKTFTAGVQTGEYDHTLTVDEMPPHKHTYAFRDDGARKVTTVTSGMSIGKRTGVNTGSAGGGGAHNNVQPSFAVYVWKRIS